MENFSTIAVKLTRFKHPPPDYPIFILAQMVILQPSQDCDPTILSVLYGSLGKSTNDGQINPRLS